MALLNTIKSLFRKKKDDEEIGAQPAPTPVSLAPTPAPAPAPADLKPINLKDTWEKIKTTIGNIDTGVKPSTGLFGIEAGLGGEGLTPRDTSEPTIKVRELFDPQSYKGGNRVAKAAGVTLEDVMNATVPGAGEGIAKSAITLKSLAKEIPKTVALGESVLAGMKYLKEGKLPSGEEIALSAPLIAIAGVQPTTESRIARADDIASLLKQKLGVKSIDLADEAAAPARVPWKNVLSTLKEYTVDNKLLKRLEKGEVVEGDGFVLQKRGEQLMASIDNSFKPVSQAIKRVADGVRLDKKVEPPAPEIKWVDQKIFAKSLDRARSAGKKKLADIPEVGYWKPEELNRTQVEAVKSSLLGGDRINPIVLDPDGNVLDGAHRLQALKELGVKDVEVVVQKPLTEAKPVISPDMTNVRIDPVVDSVTKDPLLLPQGEIKVPGVSEAKRKFKSKGVQLDFVNKLKPNEEPINIPLGGVTGKKLYDPGAPVQEPSVTFDKQYLKALEDEYGLVKTTGKGGLELPPEIIASIKDWKDMTEYPVLKKIGGANKLGLNLSTNRRVIEDVAGDRMATKLDDFFFGRIVKDTQNIQNELAKVNREIKENIIGNLGIKPDSSDDALTMRFGEKKISLEDLKQATPNWENVVKANEYFRNLYDDFLVRINNTITPFGYEPVKKRADYYTHYEELGRLWTVFGRVMQEDKLPAYLQGLTQDFKPGKEFFRFAQPRLGEGTKESAIGAVQTYLGPALNQIYRTETIQRGRLLERLLRETLEKDIKNGVVPPSHLANFTSWLGNLVNIVAGKKSLGARGSESDYGRGIYETITTLRRQSSANLVGGNIASALTNIIPLTQALATVDKASLLKGMIRAMTAPMTEVNDYNIDGLQSSFARNRFQTPKLNPDLWEKSADVSTLGFQLVDRFVTNTIVGGKYFEGLKNGLSKQEALKEADKFGAQLMADRSFAQIPQYFQPGNVFEEMLKAFQLEVNNQFTYLFRDIPKENRGNALKTASVLGQIALYSYLYNNLSEYFTGRRPAIDPIDYVASTIDELESNDKPTKKAAEIAKKWLANVPMIGNLVGGGRLPISAFAPNLAEVEDHPIRELFKPVSLLLPAGGYQIYKTTGGIQDYLQGYSDNSSGAVKYPI